MNGAQLIVQVLHEQEVEVVFGIPGGANLPLYHALTDAPFKHVLCRHEQGAGHAAEGYAKATGRVGVAIATSGPGATNLTTPIADAMLDSVPTVFIIGQVRTDLLGTDGFQEADALGITLPIVKHSFLVRDAEEIEASLVQAFHIAGSGRPGPVVIEIPQDILRAEITREGNIDTSLPGYQPTLEGNRRQIKRAADVIRLAHRPVLYTGGGALHAWREVKRLADLGLPTTSTVMGLGTLPSDHPSWLGMPGMHGTRTANYSLDEADLIIAVGARFDDRVTGKLDEFAPMAKIVHIDVDPAEIGKNRDANLPLVGDAKHALAHLANDLEAGEAVPAWTEWWERIHHWQEEFPLSYQKEDGIIKPQQAIQMLAQLTQGQAVVVSDVGQHQMWCAQYYPFQRPYQWINSGGLGTMGFGLPAGMGAQVALPQGQVVTVAGDGGLIMTAAEMSTLAENDIPLKILLLNNGGFGMVRQWQELFYEENYSSVFLGHTIDWPMLAQALGVKGMQAIDPDLLEQQMTEWLEFPGPALLEVKIAEAENCYPMIPAGAAARDMIG